MESEIARGFDVPPFGVRSLCFPSVPLQENFFLYAVSMILKNVKPPFFGSGSTRIRS